MRKLRQRTSSSTLIYRLRCFKNVYFSIRLADNFICWANTIQGGNSRKLIYPKDKPLWLSVCESLPDILCCFLKIPNLPNLKPSWYQIISKPINITSCRDHFPTVANSSILHNIKSIDYLLQPLYPPYNSCNLPFARRMRALEFHTKHVRSNTFTYQYPFHYRLCLHSSFTNSRRLLRYSSEPKSFHH